MIFKLKEKILSKNTRSKLNDFLDEYKSKSYTLDLGCGKSPYIKYFPNRVGFDFVKREKVDKTGDIHKLPFKDKEFDIVLCTEVLEHSHSPRIAISEMNRVLETGGKLILTTRFVFPLHDSPFDFFRYTKYGLKELFKDWEIIELREEMGTMETLGTLLQRLAFQIDFKGGKITKVFFLVLAKFVSKTSFLIKEEFGKRHSGNIFKEDTIMASGYYIVCRKKIK